MKIKVLYEDNIKNGHKVYTTIEVPDDDYTVILDMDYEQRLAEAEPDKRDQVKRCNTLQEVFDYMNKAEYNGWRKHHRYLGNTKAQAYEDDGTGDDGDDGATWCEPLMTEVRDNRIFRKDEIERDKRDDYDEVCQRIRAVLEKKPDWAEAFIAVCLDGEEETAYARRIGDTQSNVAHKLARAKKKLQQNFEKRHK